MTVLIIDDEPSLRQIVSLVLSEEGYEVQSARDGEEGLAKALEIQPDIILCDVRMPRMTGLEFLKRYRAEGGTGLVITMTAYGSMELAIEAMKAGAYDYLPKPFDPEQLKLTLKKAEEREALRREVGRLREEVRVERRFTQIIAKSPAMRDALDVAVKVARHPSPVLITGESGTGKELVARLIHAESNRANGPFVPVNCGAIPENLLESELFGYVKGAFTGADRDRPGLFETAAVSHQQSRPGAEGCGDRDHKRYRQSERVGTCDHQHSYDTLDDKGARSAQGCPCQKRDGGGGDRGQREEESSAVRQSLRSRTGRLRLLDKPHNARKRGPVARARDLDPERSRSVHRSGNHLCAFRLWNRNGFSCNHRLVDVTSPAAHDAVGRNRFPGPDQHEIALTELGQGHIVDTVIGDSPGGAREEPGELAQSPAGLRDRPHFHPVPEQHDGD